MSSFRYRIKTFFKYQDLLRQLVSRDLKLKYRRSLLGYLWSILNPLLVMMVMTVVFSAMFRHNIANYPVYLIIGRMVFEFMSQSTNAAMRSVTGNAALLKKTYVPKYIFTLSKITSTMVENVFSLGALLIVMLATRSAFHWQMILIPLIIFQMYLFCCGLGFILAELNVFFRDIQYIYRAITTAWMYLTPIFYPIENLPEGIQLFVKICNPLYYYVAQFRDVTMYGRLPGPRIFFGGWIIGIVTLLLGIWLFGRRKDKFILYI